LKNGAVIYFSITNIYGQLFLRENFVSGMMFL